MGLNRQPEACEEVAKPGRETRGSLQKLVAIRKTRAEDKRGLAALGRLPGESGPCCSKQGPAER